MNHPCSQGGTRRSGRPMPKALLSAAALVAAATAIGAPAAHAAEPAVLDLTGKTAPAAAFAPLAADAKAAKSGKTRVIVGLQARFDPAEATTTAKAAALSDRLAPARDRVLSALKGQDFRVVRTFDSVPYVSLELSAPALAALKASGTAASISEEHELKPNLAQTTQIIESAQQNAYRGWDGTDEVVAVLDTGIQNTHPFFAGRIVEESCFSVVASCPNGQTSQFGAGAAAHNSQWGDHGTAVAGVVAGKRSGSGTFDGVAPAAKIMPIQIYAQNSGAGDTILMAALDHVLARANAGVKVAAVNISSGGGLNSSDAGCDVWPVKASIDALRAKGIPTIISAGNDGSATGVSYPGCISTAVTVGAVNITDQVIYNASPQVELLAHGDVTTATSGSGFGGWSGTSFSAPHVAGAWALYAQRFPGTSVTDALAAFQRGGKAIVDNRSGTPVPLKRLNVAGAFSRWGYAIAKQPTAASYTPGAAQRGNSTGGVNTVLRSSTGVYVVLFPGLGNGLRGNAQATAYFASGNRCKPRSFSGTGTTARIGVVCTTPAGVPADTEFTASFRVDEGKRPTRGGYLTALDVSSASHEPFETLQANSTGGINTVETTGLGRNTAVFPGWASGSAGVPHVTAIGTNGSTCQIASWINTTVGVRCFDATGAPADVIHSVVFDHLSVLTGKGGYLFANNKTSTTEYTPAAGSSWNSTGAVNTAVKTGTGEYRVKIPGVTTGGAPIVTAVDPDVAVSCHPYFAPATYVLVNCRDAAGALVDAKFTVSYSNPV